jgi:ribonuclease D
VRQAVDLQQSGAFNSKQQGSLGALVNRTLGKPLNKAQQASNWAQRPLSEAQLRYAACDAHVLTVLYDKLVAGT